MRDRRPLAAVVIVSTVLGMPACASRQASSPFILRQGRGPVHVGDLPRVSPEDRHKADQARREALARHAAEKASPVPSIERLDPALRDALAALGRGETSESHLAVAGSYWRLGVYDAAFDHYSDAIRLNPKSATGWDGRARVWRHWGMIEPALSDIHRALFYEPGRADVRNTLGTILEAAGQCAGARDAYAAALKLDATAVWAKANLDRLTCADSVRTSDPIRPVGRNQ